VSLYQLRQHVFCRNRAVGHRRPHNELMEAGNRTGEVRASVGVAGAMRGTRVDVLAYAPIHPWSVGMVVVCGRPEV
jgi:hypothetical protein